jgi:hypothetical protein
MQSSDFINLAIAAFTAIALGAALVSAISSSRSSKEASKAAEEGRKIAGEQTKAMMTAAKANALASRINFYSEQIAAATPSDELRQFGIGLGSVMELKKRREHLAYWLDRQADALEIGLRFDCPGSPHNNEVPRWKGERAS